MNRLILILAVIFITATSVHAQKTYDIKEMTPPVKSALESRRARFDQLAELKKQGIVGENNRGYTEVLASGVDNAAALVNAENADRKVIYQAIVEQNKLPATSLGLVEEVFAKVQRDKAAAGDKIQTVDGKWVTK